MLSHLESCLSFKYIAVDTEGFTADTILGLSVAPPMSEGMYFPIGHMEDVNVDKEVQEAIAYTLLEVPYRIMHNAGHDLTILPYLAHLPFACTMIMAHMVNENLWSKSLDAVHAHFCGGPGKKKHPVMESIIKTLGWEYVPYSLMSAYGAVDAQITMEAFLAILPLYEEQFGPLWTLQVGS